MPSIIIFSKDRPMQLHAYLESLLSLSDAQESDITVLYCCSADIDYGKVVHTFTGIKWLQEKHFHTELLSAIGASKEYIMFGCDDVVFTNSFSLEFAENVLNQDEEIFGFSFRLGDNIRPQPNDISFGNGYYEWSWANSNEIHYNYPWELDCTLYRKSDVERMIQAWGLPIASPNYFEGNFALNPKKYITRKKLACLPGKSRSLVITVNAVQDTHQNGFDSKKLTDIYSLDNLYNKKNNKLDIKAIAEIENHQIHVGSEFFILKNYDQDWEGASYIRQARKKSTPLKTFFKNIGYLFKFDIKKIANESVSNVDLGVVLDGLKYEIVDDLQRIKRPNIKNSEETIRELIDKKRSFCRFGDGEFSLIDGENISFQKADARLSRRLLEILQSEKENILIGIPYYYFSSLEGLRSYQKSFARSWVARHREKINQLIKPGKQYYDTACSQLYALYDVYDFREYFSTIKEIWRKRDVVIICGETVFDVISNNIFDCANSLSYQYAPSFNAFDKYDELLANAMKISKDKLIITILGPTATVLAYDLANQGYQALDFGHIAKDYDFYSKRIPHDSKTIASFYKPD